MLEMFSKDDLIEEMTSQHSSLENKLFSAVSEIRETQNIAAYNQMISFLIRQEEILLQKIRDKEDEMKKRNHEKVCEQHEIEYDNLAEQCNNLAEQCNNLIDKYVKKTDGVCNLKKDLRNTEHYLHKVKRKNAMLERKLKYRWKNENSKVDRNS